MKPKRSLEVGPYTADQILEGSRYELSNGHRIHCMPTGRRGARANLLGGEALETDPAVNSAGVDLGISPDANTLRAPDIAVGDFANEPGWAVGAPPLAVEYADTGQDEKQLRDKIAELLAAGTQYVWVVRLSGPRRVEVHQKGKRIKVMKPGDELTAPGILKNPVPVDAMFDRDAAHAVAFRNLLQRQGYNSLQEVHEKGRDEGRDEGRRELLIKLLAQRFGPLPDSAVARVNTSTSAELDTWAERLLTSPTLADVLD